MGKSRKISPWAILLGLPPIAAADTAARAAIDTVAGAAAAAGVL